MTGMTNDGFEIKRVPEIKLQMEDAIRTALGADATLLPDSIEGQLISLLSTSYATLWEEVNNAYGAFNPLAVTGQAVT